MQDKSIFEKYSSHMKKEGVLNAGLIGLSVGGAVSTALAFVCMFGGASLALTLLLTLGLWIIVGAAVAVVLYFIKFRPTERKMAERADATGLQERSITMLELSNEDSFIAQLQRADASEHIARASGIALSKLSVSVLPIVFASVCAVSGAAMTTVSSLMAAEIIPPIVVTEPSLIPEGYVAVSYMVEEGGEIEGEEEQLVLAGESAEPVTAVPDEGWAFVEWSDGVTDPYRYDTQIGEDLTVTAIFEEIEGNEGEDSDGEGKDSDDDNSKPSENQSDQSDPSDDDPPPDEQETPDNPQSKYEEKNQVIDGETYYRDVEGYYNAVVQKLTSGTELTQEERDFIEKYFGSI